METEITAQWAKDNHLNSYSNILKRVLKLIEDESVYSDHVKVLGEIDANIIFILVNRGFGVVTEYLNGKPYTVISWYKLNK